MNNRQGGRRRGRNNNNNNNNHRSQSGGGRGGVDQANRIDSRARGNAVQMIEKFKNLARDAQLSGDRVQTEYYLQFADHYFRVHSDFRARQEERNGGQSDRQDRQREVRGVEDFDAHDDTDLDEGQGDEAGEREEAREGRGERSDRGERQDRGDRNPRQDRGERNDRGDRQDRPRRDDRDADRESDRGNRQPRADRAPTARTPAVEAETETPAVEAEEAKPVRARRTPRRTRDADGDTDAGGIDSAVLPPAIGRPAPAAEPEAGETGEEAPAPKPRRTRRTLAARDTGVEAAE